MHDLPTKPGARIIRQEDAQYWRDGFAFLTLAKARVAEQEDKLLQERQLAQQEGFKLGYETGASQSARLLCETTSKVNQHIASLEDEMVRLCIEIVRKIIGQYSASEIVTRMAIEALHGFQRERDISLMVAPELAEAVAQQLAEDYRNPSLQITVVPDARMEGTQCVLANAISVVDAGLETQLEAIRAALISAPPQKPAGI